MILVLLFALAGLAGCSSPLYVCHPASLVRQTGQAKQEILICFQHQQDELTTQAIEDEAVLVNPK